VATPALQRAGDGFVPLDARYAASRSQPTVLAVTAGIAWAETPMA